jgi:ABC-type polysaccharide/polyol phosphate transport system ATPase subunit
MSDDIAIKVENLTKIYKLYDSPLDRLKEALYPFKKSFHSDFYALENVSLEIVKGETVGIIGQNGAGKSTLLKLITGVITPSSGEVKVRGRISALLELGAGFNPDISGLENVFFNGTLMGFTRSQMEAKIDDILSFADIGEFVHQPVRIYSSGMFIRLAFALATHIDPEILIVDEALSVGDTLFQGKCMGKIKSLMNEGVTTLFVTHSMDTINTLCNRAYVLDGGKVFSYGKAQVVSLQYYQLIREREHANQELKNATTQAEKSAIHAKERELVEQIKEKSDQKNFTYGTGGAKITSLALINSEGVEANIFRCGEIIKVQIQVEYLSTVENPCFGFTISNIAGQNLLSVHTYHDGDIRLKPQNSGDVVSIEMETTMSLNPGRYLLSIGAMDTKTLHDFKNLDARKNICKVEVYGKEHYHGIVHHEPKVRQLS